MSIILPVKCPECGCENKIDLDLYPQRSSLGLYDICDDCHVAYCFDIETVTVIVPFSVRNSRVQ